MAMGMEMNIEGIIVDQIIEETIIDKIAETKGMGIEAQVKTTVGLGKDIEVTPEITLGYIPTTEVKIGIEIDLAVDMKDKGPEQNPEDWDRESRSTTRSRSSSHVNTNRDRLRCFRCSEYDYFAGECPNALTDEESGSNSEDLDDSTWQILSQDGASAFHDFDMEDLNM